MSYDDERILVNFSVWESVEALKDYAYRSAHAELYRRRHDWFEPFEGAYSVLWWIPAGHIPTLNKRKNDSPICRRTLRQPTRSGSKPYTSRMGSRSRALVAMSGALVYALVGGLLLFSSLTSLLVAVREVRGSGGLGAVSIGISEMLVELGVLVLPVAALVANRMLAPWARRSEGAVKTIHRAQLWSWIVALVALVATPAIFLMSLPSVAFLPFLALPMDGVLWGAQFVLMAALLGMYAWRTSRT